MYSHKDGRIFCERNHQHHQRSLHDAAKVDDDFGAGEGEEEQNKGGKLEGLLKGNFLDSSAFD